MNTFTAINTVFNLIKNEILPAYKLHKPGNNDTEYCVINALPIAGQELKRCFVNVNLHVKDISFPDSTAAPDTARLEFLADHYLSILEENIIGNVHLYFENQGIEKENALKEHYINIRLLCNLID